jgi:3-hydroxyisobutyrate dehydrogenase-like beta-hydroxyacid dehydrogenase
MGNGMVRKLLRAGYETVVHDRRQEAAANLIELGATWGENPAAVAAQSEVIFTSLPGPAEVDEASLGEGGILEGAREGLVHTVAKGYGNLNPGATLLTIEEEAGVKIRQNDGIGRA